MFRVRIRRFVPGCLMAMLLIAPWPTVLAQQPGEPAADYSPGAIELFVRSLELEERAEDVSRNPFEWSVTMRGTPLRLRWLPLLLPLPGLSPARGQIHPLPDPMILIGVDFAGIGGPLRVPEDRRSLEKLILKMDKQKSRRK